MALTKQQQFERDLRATIAKGREQRARQEGQPDPANAKWNTSTVDDLLPVATSFSAKEARALVGRLALAEGFFFPRMRRAPNGDLSVVAEERVRGEMIERTWTKQGERDGTNPPLPR